MMTKADFKLALLGSAFLAFGSAEAETLAINQDAAGSGWAPVNLEQAKSAAPVSSDKPKPPAKADKVVEPASNERAKSLTEPGGTAADASSISVSPEPGPSVKKDTPKGAAEESGKRTESGPSPAATLPAQPSVQSQPVVKEYSDAVQRFCSNIGPTAIEARTAAQKKMIAALVQDLEMRIERLQSKIAESRAWINRREAFAAKATASLVQVLSKMDPEAAAAQLSQMDTETAAALLLKLEPKAAAPLLGEMPAAKAAQLAAVLAASTGTLGRQSRPQTARVGAGLQTQSGGSIDSSGPTGSVRPSAVSASAPEDIGRSTISPANRALSGAVP